MTRQWFYSSEQARVRKEINEDLVVALVRQERKVNPRAGAKKVLIAIRPEFKKAGINIGVNRFGNVLKKYNLLIKKRKSYRCCTTRQDPSLIPSPNLVKDLTIDSPNQAVCSDITYIYTKEGFVYLLLMMDMYAKDIVGYDVRDDLTTEGPLAALKMASKKLGPKAKPIAHSDRGCQYASHMYRNLLDTLGWRSSMTEELHCYENGMAERLNGILKNEYFLDAIFKTKEEAREAIKTAIWTYNHRRLHEKLNYRTPSEFRKSFEGAA